MLGGEVDDKNNPNSFESPDEFERRIFGETSGGNFRSDAFFTKLDRLGMGRDGQGLNPSGGGGSGSGSHILDGLDESFNTLSDGMDGKLEKAATDFDIDYEEINQEEYSYRPDVNFELGMTYDLKVCYGATSLSFLPFHFYVIVIITACTYFVVL